MEKFGYPVGKMPSGYLYIFKEQSKMGRLILAYKDHVSEIVDIPDEERNQFFADINKVAKAIHKIFSPSKVNYGMYGDTGCHLHMHLVPKYEGGDEWGSTFTMNPDKYPRSALYKEHRKQNRSNVRYFNTKKIQREGEFKHL